MFGLAEMVVKKIANMIEIRKILAITTAFVFVLKAINGSLPAEFVKDVVLVVFTAYFIQYTGDKGQKPGV